MHAAAHLLGASHHHAMPFRLLLLLFCLPALSAWAPARAGRILPRRIPQRAGVAHLGSSEGPDQPQDPMQIIRDAGLAGGISYFCVETSFFAVALPSGYFAYHASTGIWLDAMQLVTGGEGRAEVLALLVAYVFLLKTLFPFRLGATLLLTPRVKAMLNDRLGSSE